MTSPKWALLGSSEDSPPEGYLVYEYSPDLVDQLIQDGEDAWVVYGSEESQPMKRENAAMASMVAEKEPHHGGEMEQIDLGEEFANDNVKNAPKEESSIEPMPGIN